ncbi:MAG: PTS fructose transporter subunit IIB, partial [Lactococcus sp.]|nr:PTS fructose transporter subunit IIB [Lactococcus sp.]
MKIVGVAACTSGIAHTYIAKEKLIKAAKSLGHEIWIETQGTIGVED